MKNPTQLFLITAFVLSQALIIGTLSSFIRPDEYKYVKEISGVRIYYAIKSYSPKSGKTAKKIVFKLKNSTSSPKTLTFKTSIFTEEKMPLIMEVKQCLKGNEENLKQELATSSKEVKNVKLEGDKVVEGGC